MITEVFKMPKGNLHKPLARGEAKRYSSGTERFLTKTRIESS
jgi:hypothetical protein